eukprot:1748253-Pleurochrysis_carterae.AAC.2
MGLCSCRPQSAGHFQSPSGADWYVWQSRLRSASISTSPVATVEQGAYVRLSCDFNASKFPDCCWAAYISKQPQPSRMQCQVEDTVLALGLPFRAQVTTGIGWSIHIVTKWEGAEIGNELNGPTHFLGQDPNGPTMLKRRQLRRLEKRELCSVPYREWNNVSSDAKRR